jgi:hypothetical protein
VNCDEDVNPVDSLLILRFDAGLAVNTNGCPAMGTQLDVTIAVVRTWGDLDCSSLINPVDSLKTLREDAGLGYSKGDVTCPDAGQMVTVAQNSTGTGTAAATPTGTVAPTGSATPAGSVSPTASATPTGTPGPATPTPGGIQGVNLCWVAIFSNDVINGFTEEETCEGAQGNSYTCANPPQNFELTCTTDDNAADYFCDGDLEPSPCTSDGTGGYPDYECAWNGGDTETCTTDDAGWPDYVCTSNNAALVNCQTDHVNHPDMICLVVDGHYSCS